MTALAMAQGLTPVEICWLALHKKESVKEAIDGDKILPRKKEKISIF